MTLVNLQDKKVRDFLTRRRALVSRLAVVSRRGRTFFPHISSVWYIWQNNSFWISTVENRLKVRAIRENKRVALIIDTDTPPYEGIIVEGVANLTKKNVRKVTLEIVKRYVASKDVREEFFDLMKYDRVLIKVRPIKAMDTMSYRSIK